MAIELVGRLAGLNPAYVLPALRRLLLQLLTDLEYSADSKHKEDSARLLGNLIDAAPRLVLPYVSPVLKSLVNKLKPQAERQGMAEVAAMKFSRPGVRRFGKQTHEQSVLPLWKQKSQKSK